MPEARGPDPGAAVAAALAEAAARLRAAGLDDPWGEARVLLGRVLGVHRARLAFDPPGMDAAAAATFRALVDRRALREPAAYLIGEREFRSRAFRVTPAVLVPRPETEHLVEAALAALPADAPGRVADVGTGSGCIAVSVAAERPHAVVVAIDRSAAALDVARGNAERHGVAGRVRFLRGDLLESLRGPLDVVISNPPYVPVADPVEPECLHEPREALFSGADGLDACRRLVPAAARCLRPGGRVFVETSGDERAASAVEGLFRAAGLTPLTRTPDLAGRPRVVAAARPVRGATGGTPRGGPRRPGATRR